jgi:hypothetical protein
MHLHVSRRSQNKQRLFLFTALTYRFFIIEAESVYHAVRTMSLIRQLQFRPWWVKHALCYKIGAEKYESNDFQWYSWMRSFCWLPSLNSIQHFVSVTVTVLSTLGPYSDLQTCFPGYLTDAAKSTPNLSYLLSGDVKMPHKDSMDNCSISQVS